MRRSLYSFITSVQRTLFISEVCTGGQKLCTIAPPALGKENRILAPEALSQSRILVQYRYIAYPSLILNIKFDIIIDVTRI